MLEVDGLTKRYGTNLASISTPTFYIDSKA